MREKLLSWGLADYPAARAIGLNSIFAEPPRFDLLAAHFLGSYHHYGDALFRCFMELQPFLKISAENVRLDLYASGEYSHPARTTVGRTVELALVCYRIPKLYILTF